MGYSPVSQMVDAMILAMAYAYSSSAVVQLTTKHSSRNPGKSEGIAKKYLGLRIAPKDSTRTHPKRDDERREVWALSRILSVRESFTESWEF